MHLREGVCSEKSVFWKAALWNFCSEGKRKEFLIRKLFLTNDIYSQEHYMQNSVISEVIKYFPAISR